MLQLQLGQVYSAPVVTVQIQSVNFPMNCPNLAIYIEASTLTGAGLQCTRNGRADPKFQLPYELS